MRTSVTRLRAPGVIRRCGVLAALIVVGLMASSRSHAQTTERISDVNAPGRFSDFPAISADGRYVAFVSWDDQIVAGDTNGEPDVFLHDRDANENGIFDQPGFTATTLVSMNPSTGAIGDGPSGCPGCRPSISPDGQYVAFASAASNLIANDTNNAWDIFVRGIRLHQDVNDPNIIIEVDETFRVSVANDGSEANFASFAPGVTQDLGWIITAFHSYASNIDPAGAESDTNQAKDVFVRIVPVNEP